MGNILGRIKCNDELLIGDYNKATLKNEMINYDARINISFDQMIRRMKSLIIQLSYSLLNRIYPCQFKIISLNDILFYLVHQKTFSSSVLGSSTQIWETDLVESNVM